MPAIIAALPSAGCASACCCRRSAPRTASISDQEMNRLIGQAASQYQGKERETFLQLVQQEPMAAAQLRAPLYEDKVVDFLFGKAEVTDRKATREQLEADLESEEGHVHGPGCGHDHAATRGRPEGRRRRRRQEASREIAPQPKEPRPQAESKPRSPCRPSRSRREGRRAKPPKPAKPVRASPRNKAPEAAQAAKAAKPAPKAEAKAAAKPKEAGEEGLSERADRLRGTERRDRRSAATGFRLDYLPRGRSRHGGAQQWRGSGAPDHAGARAAPCDGLPPFAPEFVLTRAGASPAAGPRRNALSRPDPDPSRRPLHRLAHLDPGGRPGLRLGPLSTASHFR